MEKNSLNPTDDFSHLKTGEMVPGFEWKDEKGTSFSSHIFYGKPLLIILFAAGCRHCRENFSYLEKALFSKDVSSVNIIAFGRECDNQQIENYRRHYNLTFQFIADPDKIVYLKFAEKVVPRHYLFNSKGKLMLSVRGFRSLEIDEIISRIEKNKL